MERRKVEPGRVSSGMGGEMGRARLPLMRIAGGEPLPGEVKPMEGPIVAALLPVLARTLRIKPDELMANPDTRILENKHDPEEETLGASSLQSLRAKNAVEEMFGFKVSDSELGSYRSLRTIVERVGQELEARETLNDVKYTVVEETRGPITEGNT